MALRYEYGIRIMLGIRYTRRFGTRCEPYDTVHEKDQISMVDRLVVGGVAQARSSRPGRGGDHWHPDVEVEC